ncbi:MULTISPECIES: hypothetical protein [unclassified Paenibacillus]|uniref:hypothetical protein n=1 Tax=unclassified Paenibacillus TaxID=185978 RepID=UPI002F411BBE
MTDESNLHRKVRAYYFNAAFQMEFSYEFSHRFMKKASAYGFLNCNVNAPMQVVEYQVDLETDLIIRPYSEHNTFLFMNEYKAIPPQRVVIKDYVIYKMNYKVPITYDWKQFIQEGADHAVSLPMMQQLLRKQLIYDENKVPMDISIKVNSLYVEWK